MSDVTAQDTVFFDDEVLLESRPSSLLTSRRDQ